MKLSLLFEEDHPNHSECVLYTNDGVETIEDLSWAFSQAARAAGFFYVTDVTIHTQSGD